MQEDNIEVVKNKEELTPNNYSETKNKIIKNEDEGKFIYIIHQKMKNIKELQKIMLPIMLI